MLNIAAGRAHTVSEVAEIVRRVVPGADIDIGSSLTPLEETNLKMRAPLDITMAKRLLDWSPQWPIEEGIGQYAERFKCHLQSPH